MNRHPVNCHCQAWATGSPPAEAMSLSRRTLATFSQPNILSRHFHVSRPRTARKRSDAGMARLQGVQAWSPREARALDISISDHAEQQMRDMSNFPCTYRPVVRRIPVCACTKRVEVRDPLPLGDAGTRDLHNTRANTDNCSRFSLTVKTLGANQPCQGGSCLLASRGKPCIKSVVQQGIASQATPISLRFSIECAYRPTGTTASQSRVGVQLI